ncbi:AI-2E family transporter [Curvibacter sp. CHRR-16]|uniref:AI-2E family transporter n=1 Tax=Curvibacter sp. CHRR-16 TaxID=2835872 RepID=UPI001BD9BA65|nr:AI-2E family transporter [Curvibacter sp. CHRR-16]MBT0569172.1 AI-2E family transporter [Curvibacter sp. CHRR-16]
MLPSPLLTPAQKKALFWLALVAVLLTLQHLLAPVLAPFVVAAALAYVLHPLVTRLQQRSPRWWPRWLTVLVVELLLLVLLFGVVCLLVPIVLTELPRIRDQLPPMLQRVQDSLLPWLAQWGIKVDGAVLDEATLRDWMANYLQANVQTMLASALASLRLGGSVAVAVVGNAMLIPVVLYYLLQDGPQFVERLHDLLPTAYRDAVHSFLEECHSVLSQYLHGQVLVMGSLALYYSVALMLGGLDLAWPIGTFTGLAVFVPYIGFGLGLVLALLSALLQFGADGMLYPLLLVGCVYGLGQVVESFFLTPRLVGERIGLHPLGVIFALMAFAQLMGFVGVLVALPASAVLLVALRRLRQWYQASSLHQE